MSVAQGQQAVNSFWIKLNHSLFTGERFKGN